MNKIKTALGRIGTILRPKWVWVAETIAEVLEFLLLVLIGVAGFFPWLLWRFIRWLIGRLRKGEKPNGAD